MTYVVNQKTDIAASKCHNKSSLQIIEPTTESGLDSVRIAVLQGEHKIDYYSGVKWAAPVSEMMQEVFVNAFEQSHAFSTVSTEAETVHVDYQLTADIRNYEVTDAANGQIHLRFVAKLVRASDHKILATIPVEKTLAPQENKIESIIAAFNSASGEAAKNVVEGVTAALPKCKTMKSDSHPE